MADGRLRSAKRPIAIVRRPLSSLLLPIPVVCFVGALLTDLAYMNSGGNLIWVNFSSWLLAAGLAFGAFAGLVLLIDAIRGAASWIQFGLLLVTFVVQFINSLAHARDGWTAVVPLGLTLSIVGAILILLTGWLGQSVPYRMAGEAV
jgi:uncharacterized membrane protein